MKIIDQSHALIPMDQMKLTEHIERVARTCYQSEGKIKEGSDKELCRKLIKRQHDAMLEHGIITIELDSFQMDELNSISFHIRKYMHVSRLDDGKIIITASVRTWRDLQKDTSSLYFLSLIWTLGEVYKDLFFDLEYSSYVKEERIPVNFKVIEEATLPLKAQIDHRFLSVRFITNLGVTHELVRHRPASYGQESIRYVSYKGGMEFIRPVFDWAQGDIEQQLSIGKGFHLFYEWYNGCDYSEKRYKAMIKHGASPQEAREVLPKALKTEIVVTCNIREWRHIFKLRTAKAAHPQIRELMMPLQRQLITELPELFARLDIISNG